MVLRQGEPYMKLEELKEKARRHEQREEWQKALDLYREALRLHPKDEPEDIGLYNRVGDLQIRLRQADAAVATYEKAVQLYLEAELPNNAIAVCKKVLRNLPDRYHFHRLMGRIRAQQGFLTDARQNFLTFAELATAAGDVETALEALLEFVELSPEDLDIRIGLAGQLAARGKSAEAVAQYSEAYRLLALQGMDQEAEVVATRLRELDPSLQLPHPDSLRLGEKVRAQEEVPMEAAPVGGSPPAEVELDLGEITLALPEERAAGIAGGKEEGEGVLSLEGFGPPEPSRALEEALEDRAGDRVPPEEVVPGSAEPPLPEDMAEGGLPLLDLGREEPEAAVEPEEGEPLPFLTWEEAEGVGAEAGTAEALGEGELPFLDVEFGDSEGEGPPPAVEAEGALPVPEGGMAGPDQGGGEGFEALGVSDLPFLDLEGGGPVAAGPGAEEEALPPSAWEGVQALPEGGEALPGPAPEGEGRGPEIYGEAADSGAGTPEGEGERTPRGGLDEALQSLKELVRQEPDSVELRQRLVELAFRKGDPEELVSAYLDLASCLRRTGSPRKARAVYQQVLSLYPGQEEAQRALAELEAEARPRPVVQVAASEEYVDLGALVFGDEEPKTTRWKVTAHAPTGDDQADFARMLHQFKKKVAEHLDAEDVAAHYDLGTAYMEMGLLDEAVAEFQVALRARPDHLPTFEMLGRCWLEMGKPEMAVRSLQRALQAPWDVEDELIGIYYHLAKAHEQLGNQRQALEFYEKVFALDINFLDVTERLRALR